MSLVATDNWPEEQKDIIEDIGDRIFGCVEGFYDDEYCQSRPWRSFAEEIGRELKDVPIPQSGPAVDQYLDTLQKHMPSCSSRILRTHRTHRTDSTGGLSNIVAIIPENTSNIFGNHIDWKCISLVGLWHFHEADYRNGVLELISHAREVFQNQPTRLFLHGFYIFGDRLDLWLFDRSGIYSGPSLKLGHSRQYLPTQLATYLCMGDANELGNNTHILHDNQGSFLICGKSSNHCSGNVYLAAEPFWKRGFGQLIDDGLSCYKTAIKDDRQFVVKFKWLSRTSLERERSISELVHQYQIPGVVELVDYQVLGNTEDMKRGLKLATPRRFMPISEPVHAHDAENILKYTTAVEDARAPEEKLLACLITYPVGRPIFQFESTLQLLRVLRDAIVSHRHLYQKANVLHQDISTTNIMIAASGTNETNVSGLLIDLDSAQDLRWGHTTSPTGTRPFMAIGVLETFLTRNIPHTYRHDLESFFYVFLHLLTYEKPKTYLAATKSLQKWVHGKPADQCGQKMYDMESNARFEWIIDDFTADFKTMHIRSLARTLRKALFPLRDGKLWVGTDLSQEGTDALYDAMIDAFEKAIAAEQVEPHQYPAWYTMSHA